MVQVPRCRARIAGRPSTRPHLFLVWILALHSCHVASSQSTLSSEETAAGTSNGSDGAKEGQDQGTARQVPGSLAPGRVIQPGPGRLGNMAGVAIEARRMLKRATQKELPRAAAAAAAAPRLSPACSSPSPFSSGAFSVTSFAIPRASGRARGAPLALRVYAPVATQSGTSAPIVVFLHGFSSSPQAYSLMLTQIASHGFIVVGPQMPFNPFNTDATPNIRSATSVVQWLTANFAAFRPSSPLVPSADFTRFAIGGHSRGGKETYGVALNLGGANVNAKAVFVIDPVDGGPNGRQTNPRILKFTSNSLTLNVPALVIGTGLGPLGSSPCAPEAFGYKFFYSDTKSPAYRFRAPTYGHADMVDNNGGSSVCQSGGAGGPMRAFCAGTVVAFLNSVVRSDGGCLTSLVSDPTQMPIVVDQVQSK